MAAKQPEVLIMLQVLQIHMFLQRQDRGLRYVRNIQISSDNGRRYLTSKIQDGSHLTGSSNHFDAL